MNASFKRADVEGNVAALLLASEIDADLIGNPRAYYRVYLAQCDRQ